MPETGSFGGVAFSKSLNTNLGAHINVWLYAVDGLAIDCGAQIMEKDVMDFFKQQKITQLAITHLHEDHCGMAGAVRHEFNVPVFLSAADIPEAEKDGEYAEYRRLTWGDRPAFEALPMPEILKTPKYTF